VLVLVSGLACAGPGAFGPRISAEEQAAYDAALAMHPADLDPTIYCIRHGAQRVGIILSSAFSNRQEAFTR
jgi:hypothetical protein